MIPLTTGAAAPTAGPALSTTKRQAGHEPSGTAEEGKPLEEMPPWAQDVVFRYALGLLRDEQATWVPYTSPRGVEFVIISACGFRYTVSKNGIA
ncbi:hypothetical protein [Streptomyces albogriseolus]|uniref:hypothetical protein n=1 Tax=Streptomyces TaxID=1883 RepID=UPI003CED143F